MGGPGSGRKKGSGISYSSSSKSRFGKSGKELKPKSKKPSMSDAEKAARKAYAKARRG